MSRYELAALLLAAAIPVILAWRGERKRRAAVLSAIRERCGSRVKAADRLRGIIAADRQAVPCGRWVRMKFGKVVAQCSRVTIAKKARWRLEWRR